METVEIKNEPKYEKLKPKIREINIFDAVDYVNDTTINTEPATREKLLQELVAELKDMILNYFEAAWNQPDTKFHTLWRISIKKE